MNVWPPSGSLNLHWLVLLDWKHWREYKPLVNCLSSSVLHPQPDSWWKTRSSLYASTRSSSDARMLNSSVSMSWRGTHQCVCVAGSVYVGRTQSSCEFVVLCWHWSSVLCLSWQHAQSVELARWTQVTILLTYCAACTAPEYSCCNVCSEGDTSQHRTNNWKVENSGKQKN